MPSVDRARVLAKLDELEGYLVQLGQFAPGTLEELRRDAGKRLVCERLLHVAIECLLDIAELFVRGARLGLPGSEAGLLDRLREGGVLGEEEFELLRGMRGFRNVLVHRYGAVDDQKLFRNLQVAPRDFRRVGKAFRDALGSSGKR